jgi:flavin reductase (DIM6/NTAB) family NADH-FMN oxidoreductase RutF
VSAATEPSRYLTPPVPGAPFESFHTVSTLVLVGTIGPDGDPDVAPKHLAMPLSWTNLFGFVCSPDHSTYRNVLATEQFTVGYPGPDQVVAVSLAAGPRDLRGAKPTLELLSLTPATTVDGVLVGGCRAHLECRLTRVVDDLDGNALLVGRVVAAHVSSRAMVEPVQADRATSDEDDEARRLQAAPLLAYAHPGRVAVVHDTKPFPYHPGFHR